MLYILRLLANRVFPDETILMDSQSSPMDSAPENPRAAHRSLFGDDLKPGIRLVQAELLTTREMDV